MKILLDENIDVRLKSFFANTPHEVLTVRDMNWNGVKNGALLKLLAENAFDVFVAVDKNLPFQQNLRTLPVTVFILDVKRNTLNFTKEYVPLLIKKLEKPLKKEIVILKI